MKTYNRKNVAFFRTPWPLRPGEAVRLQTGALSEANSVSFFRCRKNKLKFNRLLFAVNDEDDQQRKQLHRLGTPPVSETMAEVFSRCQRSFHLRLHLGAPPGQPSTRWLTVGSEERRNPDYCARQYDAASNEKTSVTPQSHVRWPPRQAPCPWLSSRLTAVFSNMTTQKRLEYRGCLIDS